VDVEAFVDEKTELVGDIQRCRADVRGDDDANGGMKARRAAAGADCSGGQQAQCRSTIHAPIPM
jgi:hypothetical protein